MLNPQLRAAGFQESFEILPAFTREVSVKVEGWDAIERALFGIVIEVSRKHHRSGLCEFQEQHLMARSMAWSELDDDGSVAENIVIGALHEDCLGIFKLCVVGRRTQTRRCVREHRCTF